MDNLKKITTILGEETVLNGTMRFADSLQINGKLNGDIESEGFLYIQEGAEVVANIKVRSIVVGGVVKGDIIATERIEMLTSGRVYGNVKTAKLKIDDGVLFEGRCEMIKDSDLIDIFSASVTQLKKTVQSV